MEPRNAKPLFEVIEGVRQRINAGGEAAASISMPCLARPFQPARRPAGRQVRDEGDCTSSLAVGYEIDDVQTVGR